MGCGGYFSAVFAGLTSIIAKCGIKKTYSDLATALRTVAVFCFQGKLSKKALIGVILMVIGTLIMAIL